MNIEDAQEWKWKINKWYHLYASSTILETSVLTRGVVISRQLTARHPRIRRSSGAAVGPRVSILSLACRPPRATSFLPRVFVSLETF